MAIDLTKKRVPPIGYVLVKNADSSLMVDDQGNPSYARMHSPASKVWQCANAAMRRKGLQRVREAGGKAEAYVETPDDIREFLNAITEEFVNVEVPLPEGQSGAKALVRAIYADDELGYIRDQMNDDSKDWGAFLPEPPSSSTSG